MPDKIPPSSCECFLGVCMTHHSPESVDGHHRGVCGYKKGVRLDVESWMLDIFFDENMEDMVVKPEDVKSRFFVILWLLWVVGSGEKARQGIWNLYFMIISYYHQSPTYTPLVAGKNSIHYGVLVSFESCILFWLMDCISWNGPMMIGGCENFDGLFQPDTGGAGWRGVVFEGLSWLVLGWVLDRPHTWKSWQVPAFSTWVRTPGCSWDGGQQDRTSQKSQNLSRIQDVEIL